MCGDHKFSSHDWVNELDIIGEYIVEIAKIESHAEGKEPWRSLWVALLVDAANNEPRVRILAMATSRLRTTRVPSTSRNTRVWKRSGANGTTTQILFCWSGGKREKTFTLHTQI